MKLPKPFYRLPVRFDAERLQMEAAALPQSAWANHPNDVAGNSSVRLISVDGGENDDVDGVMRATAHLQNSPYIRQVLASFGVVWSRSRLMRLAPGAVVPQHADINYHWFNRVRIHIPIVTRPEVRFYCEPEDVHMAPGETWIFDNWRQHRVINPTDHERIHLVADTSGSAAFWHFVFARGQEAVQQHRYDPLLDVVPVTEQTTLPTVMTPAEIEMLMLDLRSELLPQIDTDESRLRTAHYHAVLEGFCKDWRQLYLLHGERESSWPQFTQLRDGLRKASQSIAEGLVMRTNRVTAHSVLEGRILRPALQLSGYAARPAAKNVLDRPVFIIAAPRSGSTLLFETLASSRSFANLGGEAHWLVENSAELQPNATGVDSNRLRAEHVTAALGARMLQQIGEALQNAEGNKITAAERVRLLEKTPKNALRIPFFDALFPDALFVFLWRDPRENLSSIMEAWRSGQWKTYNGLDGFEGPWSLLLPPGWRTMNRCSLEEIAAFQWEATNRIALDDLSALPRQRWLSINYAALLSNPEAVVRRICDFAAVEMDAALRARCAAPLPLSKYTHTPPHADKWRRNEVAIERVLPMVELTWRRLKAL